MSLHQCGKEKQKKKRIEYNEQKKKFVVIQHFTDASGNQVSVSENNSERKSCSHNYIEREKVDQSNREREKKSCPQNYSEREKVVSECTQRKNLHSEKITSFPTFKPTQNLFQSLISFLPFSTSIF